MAIQDNIVNICGDPVPDAYLVIGRITVDLLSPSPMAELELFGFKTEDDRRALRNVQVRGVLQNIPVRKDDLLASAYESIMSRLPAAKAIIDAKPKPVEPAEPEPVEPEPAQPPTKVEG
jgi:hypothetical protein